MDRDMDVARSRLTEDAWDVAWTTGSAMSADDAIALALTPDTRTEPDRRPDPLSHREREVSALIARGMTNREIATSLSISEKTVASHIAHIMNKLIVRSRTEIAVWAVGRGLGPSG
jgi:non-specific serine/threonine protein kinase